MSEVGVISAAAKEIVQQAQSLGLTWTLRIATVVTSTLNQGLTIVFDGDTVTISATNITGQKLLGGDRVYAIMVPQSGNFVFGFADSLGTTVNYNAVTTAGTTASGSYGSLPGAPSVTISKGSVGSDLLVAVQLSCFNTVIGGLADIAVQVANTDYQVVRFFFNVANAHASFGAQRLISSIPAGSQKITGRWLQAGAGTLTQDGSDWVSITASEVRTQ
jgi:hypothetical protein